MKSLLDILRAEDHIVSDIESANRLAELFEKELEKIRNIPINCETKNRDIDLYTKKIVEHRNTAEELERELSSVREELRVYLVTLNVFGSKFI